MANEAIKEQEQQEEKTYKPTYNLKPLEADHIFLMVNIINKIGFAEIKNIFCEGKIGAEILNAITPNEKGESKNDILTKIGMNVALNGVAIILKNLECCKKDVYAILAEVSEFSVDKIRHMKIADFAKLLSDFFHKEDLRDFIQVVSSFLG